MIFRVPKTVFVPFEWDGYGWVKRDDLPRFKEPEEVAQHLMDNPDISYRKGQFVCLQWQERCESVLIDEYLRGVGTVEYNTLKH